MFEKKFRIVSVGIILSLLMIITGLSCPAPAPPAPTPPAPTPAPPAPAVIEWKGQSCFALASPLGRHAIVLWKEKVEKMSGGRLKIVLHDAGAIVAPAKVYEAVRDGILDFGMNSPAWQRGIYPAGDLFYTLPGGILEFNDLIIWMYAGGGKELAQEMYVKKEVIVFPLGLTPPEQIWTTKPVKTLEDFKGLKIRAAGLSMDLFAKLGASVVFLPGGEIVPALHRGVIDATEFLDPAMDYHLGVHEVCKYRIGPPVHMSNNMFQLLINPKKWEALPDDLKAVVENAAIAATFEGYARFWVESIKFNKKLEAYGVITTKLSPADQAKARKIGYEILEEKSKADPFFAKVWKSQREFVEKYKPYYDFTKFD